MIFDPVAAARKEATNYQLTLRQIASWHDIPEITQRSPVQASVPVLQRGLVWNPDQIELLWDSILRGFPIGSLVLSEKISGQTKSSDDTKPSINYHLLDGQQRCDAIALGFKDPFVASFAQSEVNTTASILWLDLDPSKDEWSTREFVLRLTTPSHPWGYTRNDTTSKLSAQEIRDALRRINLNPADENYQRPTPAELCPQQANVPVPLAWLLLNPCADNFWNSLLVRVENAGDSPWLGPLRNFLKDPQKELLRAHILKAIRRTERTEIIALCAPSDLLTVSRQEVGSVPDRDNITNIEHLFQRLNQQGTPLDGEELAYSMIKAYWPELAGPIDDIQKPMPATRLIGLGIRAALCGENRERLPGALGVSQIRKLASKQDERTDLVYNYIRTELKTGCLQVGDWLRYDPKDNQSGLLPVHIASIARDSPDLFLLLLTFAKRPASDWHIPEAGRAKCLQAMTTLAHWFGRDKTALAQRIYSACADHISQANIQAALVDALTGYHLRPVHSPEMVEAFFRNLPEPTLQNWNWESLGHEAKSEEERKGIWELWGEFLWFRGQMEMLTYVQRDFLHRRFSDYDPARKDFWKGHNRPWDYDHIFAKAYVHSKQGDHKSICVMWLNTIGNYRAWPMEDNRSEKAETALEKLAGDTCRVKRQDSFLELEELGAFSHAHETRKTPEASEAFVSACRDRMLRIYRNWYESVGVGELLSSIYEPVDSQMK